MAFCAPGDENLSPGSRLAHAAKLRLNASTPQKLSLGAYEWRSLNIESDSLEQTKMRSSWAPTVFRLTVLLALPVYSGERHAAWAQTPIATTTGSAARVSETASEDTVTYCDRYAASEFDDESPVIGLPFNRINPRSSVPACRDALSKNPNSARLNYEMGRAYAADREYSKALEFFSKAAASNFALAQVNMGALYLNGLGVPRDDVEAVKWTRLAANQGLAPALSDLGEMYLRGQGVTVDYVRAAQLLRAAASQGYAPAQSSLAAMYVMGRGVKQDFREALRLNGLAADQGYAPAMVALGSLYAIGQGAKEGYDDEEVAAALAADQERGSVQPRVAEPSPREDDATKAGPSHSPDDSASVAQAKPALGAGAMLNGAAADAGGPTTVLTMKPSSDVESPDGGGPSSPVTIVLRQVDQYDSSAARTTMIEIYPQSNDFFMNGFSVNNGSCHVYVADPAIVSGKQMTDRGAQASESKSIFDDHSNSSRIALNKISLPRSPFDRPMAAMRGKSLRFYTETSACDIKAVEVTVNGRDWKGSRP